MSHGWNAYCAKDPANDCFFRYVPDQVLCAVLFMCFFTNTRTSLEFWTCRAAPESCLYRQMLQGIVVTVDVWQWKSCQCNWIDYIYNSNWTMLNKFYHFNFIIHILYILETIHLFRSICVCPKVYWRLCQRYKMYMPRRSWKLFTQANAARNYSDSPCMAMET